MTFIDRLLAPIAGAGEDDDVDPAFIIQSDDPEKNDKLHELVRQRFAPNARSWVSDFQDETKLALGYLLTFQRDRAERYWDAVLPPTDITEPPALFFEWLWESCLARMTSAFLQAITM